MNVPRGRFTLVLVLLCVAFLLYKVLRPGLSRGPRGRSNHPSRQTERSREPSRSDERSSSAGHADASCKVPGVTCASEYFAAWAWPKDGSCVAGIRNGYPVPDPRCTPGGVVPNLSADTLRDPQWRTKCIRDCQSTEKQKHVTYAWYGMDAPSENSGRNQVCELDHLVPLELGGADGLGNLWPECGPNETVLKQRYFKRKDIVENYLAAKVKAGEMPLAEAQRGIASDWTQYLQETARQER